ncbi:hypothetical protein CVT25_004738 [Psilocybe cyanescens]|uniref:UrcA family protein n=1 Tax=Psilocybe cyanescens TaxID=93625 RepID=A0A409XGI4_PSICY|nr:hypothetical protein CVT25_004738 [Psilocybe cyanescens]
MFIPRVILNTFLLAIIASSALAQLEEVDTLVSRQQSNDTASTVAFIVADCAQERSDYNTLKQCVQSEVSAIGV